MSLKTMLREKVALVFKKREDVLLCKDLKEAPGPHKSTGRLQAIPIRPEHKNQLEQFIRAHHADVARSLRMLDNCFHRLPLVGHACHEAFAIDSVSVVLAAG